MVNRLCSSCVLVVVSNGVMTSSDRQPIAQANGSLKDVVLWGLMTKP